MRKKIISILTGVIMALSAVMPTGSVFAAPPVYRSNAKAELMITRINLKENYFVIKYTADRHKDDQIVFVNFQYGGMSDYNLHRLYNGEVNTILYKKQGHLVKTGGIVDGDEYKINKMHKNVKIANNTSGIIDYYITFGELEPQRSRANYRRCVDSSVFDINMMECVLEDLGDGRVTYQPYTLTGERVEIPLKEDLMLQQMTDEWRAEPGNWEAEWYVEPEPVEPEPEPVEPEPVEPEPEPVEPESEPELEPEPEPVEPELETEPDSEPEVEPELKIEPERGLEKNVGSKAEETRVETESKLGVDIKSEPESILGAEVKLEAESQTGDRTGTEEKSVERLKAEIPDSEAVGVPDLGKEIDSQPNWMAIIAISLASVAGLVGWLFLFFGKRSTKKEKGEKK